MEKFPELNRAIKSAEIIEIPQVCSKKYKFRTFAFGERGTKISNKLLKEISSGLCESIKKNFPDFDYIVSPEPGGHTWGFLAAFQLRKSINVLRCQPSYKAGEKEVPRKTGYYQHNLYFNGFKKGDKVLIVDDVVSTGGTLEIIINALVEIGVKPIGAQVIYAKSEAYKKIEDTYQIPVKFLTK